jgi:hypothetical protein
MLHGIVIPTIVKKLATCHPLTKTIILVSHGRRVMLGQEPFRIQAAMKTLSYSRIGAIRAYKDVRVMN